MKRLLFIILIGIFLQHCRSVSYDGEYRNVKVYTRLKKALKNPNEVKILHLRNKGLKTFPDAIFQLKNIEVLNLSDNSISNIPAKIEKLENLRHLILMKNNISEIPRSILKLNKLRRINLAFNNLSDSDGQFIKDSNPSIVLLISVDM